LNFEFWMFVFKFSYKMCNNAVIWLMIRLHWELLRVPQKHFVFDCVLEEGLGIWQFSLQQVTIISINALGILKWMLMIKQNSLEILSQITKFSHSIRLSLYVRLLLFRKWNVKYFNRQSLSNERNKFLNVATEWKP